MTDANHLTEQITSEQKQQNNITHTPSYIINNSFHVWKLGSINIRSGKEKIQGAKMYAIASEIDRAKLSICCLLEVRYRSSRKLWLTVASGAEYDFIWSGPKRRRDTGVGFLVKVDKDIVASDPDTETSRLIAMSIIVHGFKVRLTLIRINRTKRWLLSETAQSLHI